MNVLVTYHAGEKERAIYREVLEGPVYGTCTTLGKMNDPGY